MLTRYSHSKQVKSRCHIAHAWTAMFLVVATLAGCGSPQRFEFTRIEMGVQCRVVIYGTDRASTENAAAGAFAEVARLDAIMSDYRADSELSRLSASDPGTAVHVSPDLYSILVTAQEISRASDGAFDVTVGPLVTLWRTARRAQRLPTAEEVAAARERVGWKRIQLDAHHHAVQLARSGMKLDLGAIAKGYAAQRAVDLLRTRGFPRSLVALSGDIVVGDAPPGKPGWTIATPEGGPLVLQRVGVSTSGDDRQYVEIDGMRYAHIVDVRTGLGVVGHRATCTVIAPRGEWADALSTTGYVLGREGWAGLEAAFPGCRAMWGTEPEDPASRAHAR